MISVVVTEAGVEDEFPLLLVGFSESQEQVGRDFFFQCDLRNNDYPAQSNWPGGETYCVTNELSRTHYGGVEEVRFIDNRLTVRFSEKAATALRLDDTDFELLVEAPADLAQLRSQLRKVLTCGRPEYVPRVLDIAA